MMYVEYPELTEFERLENLPVLDVSEILLSSIEVLSAESEVENVTALRLTSVAGRPAYIATNDSGLQHVFYADNGDHLLEVNSAVAVETVNYSGFTTSLSDINYGSLVQDDQWTLSSSLHPHRPLHRVNMGDEKDAVVYVSSTTGEIVRDTNRQERFWNWLGSTIHWIYPLQLRRHEALWIDLVVILSLIGVISVVTGSIIGIMRLRVKRRERQKRGLSPYTGIDKWHHIMGLCCMVFVGTFIFSGMLSLGPWGIFESRNSSEGQVRQYAGSAFLSLSEFPTLNSTEIPVGTKEIVWSQIGGQGHLVFSRSSSERVVKLTEADTPQIMPRTLLERIELSLPDFIQQAQVVSVESVDSYDDYYYSRHNRYRPLPVYRVKFDDEESTWYHVDQNTGQVISRHTDATRLERWIYNGLHSLDFSFLLNLGLLWDVLVITLSVIGFGFCITSVILAWRRIT